MKILFKFIAILAFAITFIPTSEACFGSGIPSPPQNEYVYASPGFITAANLNTTINELTQAENRVQSWGSFDLEVMVKSPYEGSNHLYCGFGVTSVNCADRNNLIPIAQSNLFTGCGFTHDVQYSGEMFLQFASQCHTNSPSNQGAYWKGTQYYSPFDYPLVPSGDIIIDFVQLVNCTIQPYGC